MDSKGTYAKKKEQKMEAGYQNMSGKKTKGKHLKKNERKNAIIAICAVIAAVVICLVTTYLCMFYSVGNTVLKNVTVAGVDIGGMTEAQALESVNKTIKNTYLESDMVIEAFGKTLTITPEDTQITLDTEGAVAEAYAYGRTGFYTKWQKERQQASTSGYAVDLTPYLTINSSAVKDIIEDFIKENKSTLTQSTWKVTGTRPDLSQKTEDNGQVLTIQLGTPEYKCDADSFYQQIVDAYSKSCFQFTAEFEAILPDALDLTNIWESTTVKPVDATQDSITLKVTKETYGYGFNLEAAQETVQAAPYGAALEIPFEYINPTVTQETFLGDAFNDKLSTYTATQNSSADRATNLRIACETINGLILYPGDEFSYNKILGERTEEKGYRPGAAYVGNSTEALVGGGICQVASTLYYCALYSDMEILERECHQFTTVYSPLGVDATVSYGYLDFRFRNTSEHPIKIEAAANGGTVTVTFYGTDDKDYYIKMESEVLKKYPYEETYEDKTEEGYREGEYIVTPYTGYDVKTYRCKYNKDTNELISRTYEDISNYKRRDAIICKVETPTEPTEQPTIPSDLQGSGGNMSDGAGALPDDI